MQALTLMIVYVLTTAVIQFIGFLVSRLIDYEYPAFGLMTFLILFLGAFGLAWPVAVRVAEWLIRLTPSPRSYPPRASRRPCRTRW